MLARTNLRLSDLGFSRFSGSAYTGLRYSFAGLGCSGKIYEFKVLGFRFSDLKVVLCDFLV